MKPLLEQIDLNQKQQSFEFFNIEVEVFEPYWHYHPEVELTLIYKGSGTRFIGDSILPFSDLDLVLVGENLPHHWVSAINKNEANQKAYVFQFEKSLFSHFPECEHFQKLFELAKFGLHFQKPSYHLIETIIHFEASSNPEKLAKLIQILNELSENKQFQKLSSKSNYVISKSNSRQHKISKTTNYILENLDKKLTVQHMADFTYMVPQSFCRWFKMHSGHSFITFLNKTRVESACHNLLTTNLSVKDIAYSCGYNSISHFNRSFLRFKGISPSKYQKQNRV